MWIHGREVESQTTEWVDLLNPATNEVVTRVPKCTQAEMQAAVNRYVSLGGGGASMRGSLTMFGQFLSWTEYIQSGSIVHNGWVSSVCPSICPAPLCDMPEWG